MRKHPAHSVTEWKQIPDWLAGWLNLTLVKENKHLSFQINCACISPQSASSPIQAEFYMNKLLNLDYTLLHHFVMRNVFDQIKIIVNMAVHQYMYGEQINKSNATSLLTSVETCQSLIWPNARVSAVF